jgi:hypothetical protein
MNCRVEKMLNRKRKGPWQIAEVEATFVRNVNTDMMEEASFHSSGQSVITRLLLMAIIFLVLPRADIQTSSISALKSKKRKFRRKLSH